MVPVSGRAVHTAAAALGLVPGSGELIDEPTRRRLAASLAGSLLLAVLEMLGVVAMLPLLQFVAGSDRDTGALGEVRDLSGVQSDGALVVVVATLVVLAFVGKDLFALVFRRWQLGFTTAQEAALAARMLSRSLASPYPVQVAISTGDKVWLITGGVAIGYTTSLTAVLSMVTEATTIVFLLIATALVSPVVTASAVVYIGLGALVVARVVRPRIAAASRRNQVAGEAASGTAFQALGSAKEIKLRGAGELFVSRFARAREEGARANASAQFLGELPKYVIEILFVVGIGLLAVGISRGGTQPSDLVLLGVFAAAGARVMPSAVRLLAAVTQVRYGREPLRALVAERRRLENATALERARVVSSDVAQGDIVLHEVDFAYDTRPDQPVFRGLSLRVAELSTVALVGSSGAGKSTLVDLLLGLFTPDAGTITAGGSDIHDNLPGWQRRLAVVPQDVVLFDGSLRENILFDLPLDEEHLADVVGRAQLADLIATLPDGLDTLVGERGSRLSGGQRQRLGIARALYRRPTLLVLDEATSALDNETERRLTATLESLRHEMTIVIVAHRLSSVRRCDEVVHLSDGVITARGTFEEVVEQSAEFAHLVRLGSLSG